MFYTVREWLDYEGGGPPNYFCDYAKAIEYYNSVQCYKGHGVELTSLEAVDGDVLECMIKRKHNGKEIL